MHIPAQTAITTAEHDLQYKPYNVTLEQAKAYAMLHRSALVKSALDVKSAEEAVKSAKGGLFAYGCCKSWSWLW